MLKLYLLDKKCNIIYNKSAGSDFCDVRVSKVVDKKKSVKVLHHVECQKRHSWLMGSIVTHDKETPDRICGVIASEGVVVGAFTVFFALLFQ